MSSERTFVLADSPRLFEEANAFATTVIRQLRALLGSEVEVSHVGATAIAGCLTKGDVDIVVRVESKAFCAARTALDERYTQNLGSPRDDHFAGYTDESGSFPLGIQLVVDTFHTFVDHLRHSQALLASYNALKRSYAGADMEDYGKAKADFVACALAEKQL